MGGADDDVNDGVNGVFVVSTWLITYMLIPHLVCFLFVLSAVTLNILLEVSLLDPLLNVLFESFIVPGVVAEILVVVTFFGHARWVFGLSQRQGFSEKGFLDNGTHDVLSVGVEKGILTEPRFGREVASTSFGDHCLSNIASRSFLLFL